MDSCRIVAYPDIAYILPIRHDSLFADTNVMEHYFGTKTEKSEADSRQRLFFKDHHFFGTKTEKLETDLNPDISLSARISVSYGPICISAHPYSNIKLTVCYPRLSLITQFASRIFFSIILMKNCFVRRTVLLWSICTYIKSLLTPRALLTLVLAVIVEWFFYK